jgi:PAS domain S-box-containing protein
LLVLDGPGEAGSNIATLEDAGYEVKRLHLDPGMAAPPSIDWPKWDLVLALPDVDAHALSEILRSRDSAQSAVPVLVLGRDWHPERLALGVLMAAGRSGPENGARKAQGGESGEAAHKHWSRPERDEEQVRRYSAYLEHLIEARTSELRAAIRKLENETKVHRVTARALRESELRFRTIAENAPDAIFRFGRNLRLLYVNPRVADLIGQEPQALMGKTLDVSGMPEEVRERWNEALQSVFTTGKERTIDFEYPSPSGPRYLQATINPESSDEGDIRTVIGIIRDLTDIRRAEEEVRRGRESLQDEVERKTEALVAARLALAESERLRLVGKLAATVAHELRNPLGVISAATYNVRRKRSNVEIDRHLETIDEKIKESALIIENLLNYSRVRPPEPETVDVTRLVEESVLSVQSQFTSTGARIERDLEGLAGVEAELDPAQMGQVISNLLTNACQALPDGSGRVVVRGRADRDADTLVIEIEDEGIGMTEDEAEQAFEPFFTRKARGAGLGLTICREVVSRHGGTVDIRSSTDKGTVVTVRLPIERRIGAR